MIVQVIPLQQLTVFSSYQFTKYKIVFKDNKDRRNLEGGRDIIKDAVNTGEANKSLE
jgi:hypothetical protein